MVAKQKQFGEYRFIHFNPIQAGLVADIKSWSKQRKRVMARSVRAYWSVRELGMSAREIADKLCLSPSAASRCVQRGERVVASDGLILVGSQIVSDGVKMSQFRRFQNVLGFRHTRGSHRD